MFAIGQEVTVTPPMTPMARHTGRIIAKAKYGWKVRFDAWGMMLTEVLPERAIESA